MSSSRAPTPLVAVSSDRHFAMMDQKERISRTALRWSIQRRMKMVPTAIRAIWITLWLMESTVNKQQAALVRQMTLSYRRKSCRKLPTALMLRDYKRCPQMVQCTVRYILSNERYRRFLGKNVYYNSMPRVMRRNHGEQYIMLQYILRLSQRIQCGTDAHKMPSDEKTGARGHSTRCCNGLFRKYLTKTVLDLPVTQ